MRGKRLITADRIWAGAGADVIDDGFLMAEDGVITAVGRVADLGSGGDGAERIDLGDCTVVPGLINAHVHLVFSASQTPVDDYLADAQSGTPTLLARATASLEASARVGVTTVRDLGGPNEVILPLRDRAARGEVAGAQIVASGSPITAPKGHCHWFSHECAGADEVRAAVRTQADVGADLIKIFATGGNLTPGTDPFAPQYDVDALVACVDEARKHDLLVAAHAHAPEGIRRAATAKVSTIEHCLFETATSVEFDPATADLMAANDVAFVPTFGASILRLMQLPREELMPIAARMLSKFELFREALRATRAAGATLVAGSDAGIPHRHHHDFPADVAAMARDDTLGLTPVEALESATTAGADRLGLADRGRLTPGRRADVLAVDGNPLEVADDLQRTRLVWVGGRTVV